MKRIMVTLLLTVATEVSADPLGLVDYDAVIADHIDTAEVLETGRLLITLDGGVEIVTMPDGEMLFARDRSGAIGCAAMMLSSIAAIDRACPNALSEAQSAVLSDLIDQMIGAYFAGVLPEPADPAEVRRRFEMTVRAERMFFSCQSENAAEFVEVIIDRAAPALGESFQTPRLPVWEPCL